MKRPDEYALLLLSKARDDAQAVREATASGTLADWIVGFHAQQAVEKALKAVLSKFETEYPHTHSIGKLLDLIGNAKLRLPPDHAEVSGLSQFAGDIRYGARRDLGPAEFIDRAWALSCVESTLAWAADLLKADR
jgi:HEPN domain-containing protein